MLRGIIGSSIALLGLGSCSSSSLTATASRDVREAFAVQVQYEDTSAVYLRTAWMHSGDWNHQAGTCYDTRAAVLLSESTLPVVMKVNASGGCTVDSGRWVSPYTGDTLLLASKLDIDHLVPLAEANRSGGAAWDSAHKNEYANNLADPDHLVAVDLSSNRSKSDRDPTHWLPPSRGYVCKYLAAWTRVKARWQLTMDSAEYRVVRNGLDSCAAAGWSDMPSLTLR